MTTNLTLTIADTAIRQDNEGRYCLNDLHKASGNNPKHKPANFLRSQQAVDLIELLKYEKLEPTNVINGIGTLAIKEIVYAYAMWISAKFHLAVIRAYDALVTGRLPITDTQLNALAERLKPLLQSPAFGMPRPWTPEEDAEADRLRAQGLGFTRIGFSLGRSESSVKHRFTRRAQTNETHLLA